MPPQLQHLDRDHNMCFLPPLLIWHCDVIIDEQGMNMIKMMNMMKIEENQWKMMN